MIIKVILSNVLAWSDVLSNGSGLITAVRGRAGLCEFTGSTGPLQLYVIIEILSNVLAWSDVLSNSSGLVTAVRGRAGLCECAGSTGPL